MKRYDWTEVSQDNPCPICGEYAWCGRSGEVVRCMRKSDPPKGYDVIKQNKDGGAVMRPSGRQPNKPIDVKDADAKHRRFSSLTDQYEKQLTPVKRRRLAKELGVSTSSLRSLRAGWCGWRCCYTFPQFDHADRIVGIALRRPDGRKWVIRGGNLGLHIPKGWQQRGDVILCPEGASDTAACLTMGLNVIGRPNNYGGRFLPQLLGQRDVIFVGDFDPKPNGTWPGLNGAKTAAENFASEAGMATRYVCTPDRCKDIREWLQAQGVDPEDKKACRRIGRRLLKQLKTNVVDVKPPDDRFRIITGAEFMELPPPEYQVAGVFCPGNLVVLYGAPGSGKSFVALDLALSIQNGTKWLFKECERGQAMYVLTEGAGGFKRRLKAWSANRGSVADLAILTTTPNFLHRQDVGSVIAALRRLSQPPALVVVDTLARTMVGGDENSAKDVGEVIAALDQIRAEFKTTILVVHHTGKDNKSERGSTALRAAADVMILTKPDKQDKSCIRLSCQKIKDGPDFDPVFIRLKVVDVGGGHTSCHPVLASIAMNQNPKQVGANAKSKKVLLLLREAVSANREAGMSSSDIAERLNWSNATANRVLRELREGGSVESERIGRRFVYRLARKQGANRRTKSVRRLRSVQKEPSSPRPL